VKLPASFKLAGLGTYSSPYYIDTNDLILQAVPQTDVPSSFINEAWILFIVELNVILRSVQADALNIGILQLIKFVHSQKSTAHLGGLSINICTFSNIYIDPISNNNSSNDYDKNNNNYNNRDSKSDDDNQNHNQQHHLKTNEDHQKSKLKHETFDRNSSFSSGNIFIDFIDFMNDTIFRKKEGGGGSRGDDDTHMNVGSSNVDNTDNNSTVDDNVENIVHHHHQHKDIMHDDIKSFTDSNRSSNRRSSSSNSNIQETCNDQKQNIFSSIQSCISSFLSSLFYSKFDKTDLCGKKLTFDQMCSATRHGQLRLGKELMDAVNGCV
jgi:hypothetical protein